MSASPRRCAAVLGSGPSAVTGPGADKAESAASMSASPSWSAPPRNVPPPPNPDNLETVNSARHNRLVANVSLAVISGEHGDEVLTRSAQACGVQRGGQLEQGLLGR